MRPGWRLHPVGSSRRYASRLRDLLEQHDTTERAEGPKLAAAAIERFARAGDGEAVPRELIVMHNFFIGCS
jgi:hypothetical protein